MEKFITILESSIGFMNNLLWAYVLIAVLVISGLYFSLKSKFVQFSYFFEMFRIFGDKVKVSEDGKKETIRAFGEESHQLREYIRKNELFQVQGFYYIKKKQMYYYLTKIKFYHHSNDNIFMNKIMK